jgi:hypothetical protein
MKNDRTSQVRPNSVLVWQGGSASGGEHWTERENRALVAAGFEPLGEENALWSKDGIWFGRNAALQKLRANAAPKHH